MNFLLCLLFFFLFQDACGFGVQSPVIISSSIYSSPSLIWRPPRIRKGFLKLHNTLNGYHPNIHNTNKERRPTHRSEIISTPENEKKPLIFLDIDYVINCVTYKDHLGPKENFESAVIKGTDCCWSKQIIQSLKTWHEEGKAEILWLTLWMKAAQTHFAPRVDLPHFENAYIQDMYQRYPFPDCKGDWILKWYEKYPNRKIIWLEDDATDYMMKAMHYKLEVKDGKDPIWTSLLQNPKFLVLSPEKGELLNFPRDMKIVETFITDGLSPEEVLRINRENIGQEYWKKLGGR